MRGEEDGVRAQPNAIAPPPVHPRAHKVAQRNAQVAGEREAAQRARSLREKERGWQKLQPSHHVGGAGRARLSSSQPIKSKGESSWQTLDAKPARASFRSIPQSRLQAIARAEHERSSHVPTRSALVLSGGQAHNVSSKKETEDKEMEREKHRAKMSKALVTLMSKLDDPEKFTKLQNMLQRWRIQAS